MESRTKGWYVVAVLGSDYIDGPFETREACVRRCIQLSSQEILANAIATSQVSLHYYPRYNSGKYDEREPRKGSYRS